ncbi:peptidoglycan-binding protein [Bifidobacterium cuniculi]|uniref:Putative peptidoglycan-binding protein n=1 Tax=Bifidobacterium cuniculi TaxID=1688 RepID=A0A087B3C0_9BIFI|nr:peptidoglycan-binding protein [Bifidobacterium cuniculi]KFI65520.1 putative peptidoglycan-binding protein [Bifidobacterium cuniculi]
MHHRRHAWLRSLGIAVLAVLLTGLLVTGIVATVVGMRAAQEPEPEAVTLTTTIRTRTLADELSGQLVAYPHATLAVPAEGTVTRAGLAAGATLQEGGIVGVVNERPILFLQGAVPAWRTLAPGTRGADVRQLQDALMRLGYAVYDESGVYGDSTAYAAALLMGALGFDAVDASGAALPADRTKQTAIPQGQLVFLPSAAVVAADTCGTAGTAVAGTLCTLQTGARDYAVSFPASDVPDPAVLQGAPAVVPVADGPVTGTVGAVYEPPAVENDQSKENADSGTQDRAVVLQLENLDTAALPADPGSMRVTVTRQAGRTDALTVESSALRRNGDTVWVRTDTRERVPVRTGLCVQGVCEVEADGLADGTVVLLPTDGERDDG